MAPQPSSRPQPQIEGEKKRLQLAFVATAAARRLWSEEMRHPSGTSLRRQAASQLFQEHATDLKKLLGQYRHEPDFQKMAQVFNALMNKDPAGAMHPSFSREPGRSDVLDRIARPDGLMENFRDRVSKAMGIDRKFIPLERPAPIEDVMQIERMILNTMGDQIVASREWQVGQDGGAERHRRSAKALQASLVELAAGGYAVEGVKRAAHAACSEAYQSTPIPADQVIYLDRRSISPDLQQSLVEASLNRRQDQQQRNMDVQTMQAA